jgi:hypothetical protein
MASHGCALAVKRSIAGLNSAGSSRLAAGRPRICGIFSSVTPTGLPHAAQNPRSIRWPLPPATANQRGSPVTATAVFGKIVIAA